MKFLFGHRTAAEQLEHEQEEDRKELVAQARREAISIRERDVVENRGNCFSRLLEYLLGDDSVPPGPADTGDHRRVHSAAIGRHRDILGEKLARMRG